MSDEATAQAATGVLLMVIVVLAAWLVATLTRAKIRCAKCGDGNPEGVLIIMRGNFECAEGVTVNAMAVRWCPECEAHDPILPALRNALRAEANAAACRLINTICDRGPLRVVELDDAMYRRLAPAMKNRLE